MIEQALASRLSDLADNVYLTVAPLNYSRPAVVFNRLMTSYSDDLDGDPDGAWAHVQIDIYDTDAEVAIDLANMIRRSFVAWCDDEIQSASLTDEMLMTDETTQTVLQRVKQEWLIYAAIEPVNTPD